MSKYLTQSYLRYKREYQSEDKSGPESGSGDNMPSRDKEMPSGVWLPLKSKRLIAVHLQVITKVMDLTMIGSTDQVRQLRQSRAPYRQIRTEILVVL